MRRFGITPKLTLVFVLFAGAVLIGMGLPAYLIGRAALQSATFSELQTTSLEKQAALSAWVADRQNGIGDIANQYHLRETVTSFMAAAPGSSVSDLSKADLLKDMGNWAGTGHRFLILEIIDASTGRVLAATDASQEGKFRDDQPFFTNGLQAAYVSNPYYDLTRQTTGITAAAPILSTQGQVIAVLAGSLNMDEMDAIILRRSGLHQTDDAFLVNTSNLFVTQPRLNPDPAVLLRGVHTEAVNRCLAKNTGEIAALDYRGVPAFISYNWLPERQLCLIVKIDQTEALAASNTLTSAFTLTGVLVFIIGSILAFGMSRTIAGPVYQLVRGVGQIGRGNLETRIEVKSGDEIGRLGIAFNEMAANLQHSLGETAHSQRMLVALGEAAQAVQRARTSQEVYQIVGQELRKLNSQAMILKKVQDQAQLVLAYHNFDSLLLRGAEKLVGMSAEGFQFAIQPGGLYDRVFKEGQAYYSDDVLEAMSEVLPKGVTPLFGNLNAILGFEHVIYAPLYVDNQTFGMLVVTGANLSGSDLSAMTAFANQMSIALENARLYEETRAWAREMENRVAEQTKVIRASEAELRALFTALPDVIMVMDDNGRYLKIAPTGADLLYRPVNELEGKLMQDVLPREAADLFIGKIKEALRDGKPASLEYSLPVGGQYIWFAAIISPMNENSVVWAARDITKNKLDEKALRESEERYRTLSETSPEMIFVIDRQDKVQYVNARAARQFGKTSEQVTGKLRGELFPPAIAEGQARGLQQVLKTGQPVSSESPISFPSGQIWLDTQLVPLRNDTGEVSAVMGISRDITERKQAEELIRNEKLLSDSIVNSLPGIFYLFDTQGKFLRWNRNFEIVSGYAAGEMLEHNPLEFFGGEEKALVEARIQETFVKGESRIEANFISRTGIGAPYLLTGVRVEINQQTYLIGTGIDISDRKRAEEALRETNDYLESLFNYANAPIIVWDPNLLITRFNHAFERMTGYASAEVLGKPLELLFPEDSKESSLTAIAFTTSGEQWESVEIPILHRDGSIRIALWNSANLYASDGLTWVATIAQGQDITERKQAEEAVKRANSRFSLATRAASMGVWDFDPVKNQLIWDDQMFQLYGVRKEEFAGAYEAWVQGVHPGDRQRGDEEVQQALRGEKDFDAEFRVVWPDGSVKFIKGYAYVARDADGKALRMTGVNYDITALKVAEEKLVKSLDDLARSNSELERFAYVASHDLQEPLRMVTSYLQLLERRYKDKLDGDALEFINYAVDGSNRMKTLISDLLAYSRVGTRGKEFAFVNCEDVLARVLTNLQVSLEENKAMVTHDPLPQVMADNVQLESLFQNLLGNAVKFHGKKPPRIHVGVKQDEKNWIFSVSDNGIGIDPQYFERIFIIFQRLHNREEYPGTGIGLAISKRIVERHDGHIWIESQPNQGTTFHFTLPIIGES